MVENLEARRMLASGVRIIPQEKFPDKFIGPVQPSKVTLPSQTFRGSNGQVINTTNGGGGVQVNVGTVVNISRATGNQTEADIAINPTNPDQVFAQSNISSGTGLFATRSSDGGQTWTTSTIATGGDGLTAACCDGRVVYDKFGNLWLVYLNTSASATVVARSTNNGASWTQMLSRSGSWDNPAIGTGSDGSTWVEVRASSGVAGFGWKATGLGTLDMSIGGGTGFSPTQIAPGTSGTGFNYGDIAIANDGSVYMTWTNPSGGQGPNVDSITRDPDGFGPLGFTPNIGNFPTNVGGFDFIPAQNGRSIDSEPQLVVGPPGTPFAGRVYFQHAIETVNENNDIDIVLHYSDDNGQTWSPAIRINNDPANPIRSQFLNQIAVDPTTGLLVASFHDARNDNGVSPNGTNAVQNDDAQFFGAVSSDGGATWQNFLIDPGWSNAVRANNGIDFGDWTGSDFYGGRFYAVWASNAQGTNGLPNNPSPNQFDLATARVDILAQAGVYGTTFDDSNGNGVRDAGEPGISGVTAYIDSNNNGSPDGGEPTATSVGGTFVFPGLAAGTYILRAVTPAGQRPTLPASGFYTVNYSGSGVLSGFAFGFVNPRIAGTVFDDTNDNGVLDGSEGGLPGVTVYIDSNNNGSPDGGEPSVVSAANGTYTLGGLADGPYIVRAVTPAGRRLTFPASGFYSATISSGSLVFSNDNFGFTDRVRISGSVYHDANGNGVKDLGEAPFVGARVYQDVNNNGVFDNTGGTFNSTNVPINIPDSGIINSTLNISGAGNINNLTVKLNITHTFDGDLILSLISPQGTTVTLSNRRGGSGDNFTNTIFDDSAATAIANGVAPFTGSFRPDSPLSALNNQNGNGTWTLQVNDAAAQDSGVLNSWSITFGSTEPNVLTDASGNYSFPGLSAGTYNIRVQPPTNTVFTNPSNGLRTINANGGDIFTAADFGLFDTAYSGQDITLRLDPTGTKVQIWVDQPVSGAPTYTAAKAILTSLTFTGTAANDSFTLDTANGNPLTGIAVSYDGLANSNAGDLFFFKGASGADSVTFNNGNVVVNALSMTTSNIERGRFDGRNGNDNLTVNAGAPNVSMGNTQHLASLTVAAGASASVDLGANAVIVTNALSLGGLLDMTDNDMILFYTGGTSLPAVQSLINAARTGGTWAGANGLTSSAARDRVPKNTTLGAMESAEYKSVFGAGATFDGEALPGTSVLIKYTYYGDTDFNGQVNFDDYSRTDNGFNSGGTDWFHGDFDGNGVVNFDDYSLIDLAFNTQSGALRPSHYTPPAKLPRLA